MPYSHTPELVGSRQSQECERSAQTAVLCVRVESEWLGSGEPSRVARVRVEAVSLKWLFYNRSHRPMYSGDTSLIA